MGSLYTKPCIDLAISQVGQPCGKTNEYSAELDSIDYFNTKKNGVANSCAIFQSWVAYRSTLDENQQPCPSKWDAYYFLFQPSNPANNCGAGCTQQAGYFKANNAFYYSSQDACRGDWIFFTNDGGATYYHVGLVVDWGYFDELGTDGFRVIEGNTNGGYVGEHFYSYGDRRIGGFGRPRYDGWELEASGGNQEPAPEPEPDPVPIQQDKYIVSVGSYLSTRTGPGTQYDEVGRLFNGAEVSIIETSGNWAKITGNLWVSMTYLYKP